MRYGSFHLRLILFFAALGAGGSWLGTLGLERFVFDGGEGGALTLADARRVVVWTSWGVSVVGFVGVLLHRLYVLPQKQREIETYVRELEQEGAKVRALLEGAVDLLLVADRAGRVHEHNALARQRLGAHEGTEVASLFEGSHRATYEAALGDACARPGTPVEPSEVVVRSADGGSFPAALRILAVEVGDETLVEVTLRDLTRQRELERQLRLHERLGSLGLLTASVAHEINNPLEGIGNYLALVGREGVADADRARYLERIGVGFDRIRDLTRDLLRFARPEASTGRADLARVAERSIQMVGYARDCADVELRTVGLDEPCFVAGDPARLEQVLINLLLNAGRASPEGGRVTIAARREGAGVALSVEDQGPGIDEADLGRVFDPFFTKSEGTGLGLSVVYGIVQAHGGSLTVENRPTGGAVFTVHLNAPPGGPEATS